jgi:hypothetical protein
MSKDPIETTIKLTKALQQLENTADGAVAAFGRFGDTPNKVWTIFSRFVSGSWVWPIQNQIRGLSNLALVFTRRTEKQNEAQIENLESILKLQDAYKGLRKEAKNLEKTPLYKSLIELVPGEEDKVKNYTENTYKNVLNRMEGRIKTMRKGAEKVLGIAGSSTFKKYFGGEVTGEKIREMREGESLKHRKGTKIRVQQKKSIVALTNISKGFKKLQGIFAKIPWMKLFPMLLSFLGGALVFFANFMLYVIAISIGLALIINFVKTFWTEIKEVFTELWPTIKAIGEGIFKIIKGLFFIISGGLTGDFEKIVKGIGMAFEGVLTVALGLLALAIQAAILVVVATIKIAIKGIVMAIEGLWRWGGGKNSMGGASGYNLNESAIDSFASGGVSSGGWALVGERGAELVKLPTGSRVFNNQQSRNMGGNTINVHVNGRVGASDAEIRDIANKVAKEINIRMNRSSTNSMVMM